MPKYDQSTHIIYLDLPSDVAKNIDAVRKSVNSPGVKRWVAHITLKQDADYIDDNKEILDRITDFCFIIKPVSLTLDGLKLRKESDGVSWNIYVGIKEKELLHSLTKNISKLLMPLTIAETENDRQNLIWEQTSDYYPHISVVNGKGIDNGEKLLKELKYQCNPIEKIICSSVTVARWEDTRWKGIKIFDLKENY